MAPALLPRRARPPRPQFRTNKLIYRRYAGLFFTICCDVTDNELVTLEAIHLFVEILDQYFQNVCEFDLVFNFHKVYLILDEFIIGGEFQETSKKVRRAGDPRERRGAPDPLARRGSDDVRAALAARAQVILERLEELGKTL